MYAKATIDLLPDAAVVLDKDKKLLIANNTFLQQFNLKEEDISEQSFMEIVHNKWKTSKLDQLLLSGVPDEIFIQHDFQTSGLKDLFVSIKPISYNQKGRSLVSLVTFKNQDSE